MGLVHVSLRTLVLVGLVALASAISPGARADESAALESEARSLFQRGVALAREGKLEQAVDAFERSRALVERPSVLQNLAVALEGLGRVTEALRHVERAIELRGPDDITVKALQAQRARLLGQVAYLTVRVEPDDAAVWIDDQPVSASGEPLRVDPGSHGVRASKPGHVSASRVLSVLPGASHTEQLVLTRAQTEQPAKALLAPGAPEPVQDRKLARWAYGSLGAGVAAAAGGVALYVLAGRRQDAWEKRCRREPCSEPDAADAKEEVDRLDFSAYGMLAASGALLIGAGTLAWLSLRDGPRATRVGLSPSGLLVRGTF